MKFFKGDKIKVIKDGFHSIPAGKVLVYNAGVRGFYNRPPKGGYQLHLRSALEGLRGGQVIMLPGNYPLDRLLFKESLR